MLVSSQIRMWCLHTINITEIYWLKYMQGFPTMSIWLQTCHTSKRWFHAEAFSCSIFYNHQSSFFDLRAIIALFHFFTYTCKYCLLSLCTLVTFNMVSPPPPCRYMNLANWNPWLQVIEEGSTIMAYFEMILIADWQIREAPPSTSCKMININRWPLCFW